MPLHFFIGIGDEECRNKGLGKEALNLLIDYGFNEMNFYKLQLHVIEYNKAAIKLYESLGFVKKVCIEGTFTEMVEDIICICMDYLKMNGIETSNYTAYCIIFNSISHFFMLK